MEEMRVVPMSNLDNLGINPYAIKLLTKSYKEKIAPKPVKIDYYQIAEEVGNQDILETVPDVDVEISLSTAGYLGRGAGNVNDLDKRGVRDTCRSYFKYVRPRPASFIFDGVEIHIRTAGFSDQDMANITREVYDPTLNRAQRRKKKILLPKD